MRWEHQIAFGIACTLGVAAHADEFATAAGYYTTGQWRQAFVSFDRLARLTPEHPRRADAEFFRAEAMVQLGDFDLAAERFAEFVASNPDHPLAPRALFRVGESYYLAGERTRAITWLERFVRSHPRHELNEYALAYLGLALAATSDRAAARQTLVEAQQRYPGGSLAQQVSDRLRELQLAAESDAQTSDRSSAADQAASQYQLAREAYGSGDYAAALSALAQVDATVLPPTLAARIEYARGSSYQQLQQIDQAVETLDRAGAFATDPSLAARIRWKRLRLRTHAGQWDEAVREFQDWVPTGSETTWFYRQAGRSLAESAFAAGRYDQASTAFALLVTHLKDASDMAYGLSGMAWCYLRQEKWERAADLFQRLADQFPNDPQVPGALLARAHSLESMNELAAAADVYQQFIERFPQRPDRWRADLKAAELLQKQHEDHAAVQVIERGLAAANDDQVRDRLRYQWAWLRSNLGQHDAAREILQSLHDQGPSGQFWADVTYRLAKDALTRGNLNTADDLTDELLRLGLNGNTDDLGPHTFYLKARIAAQRGDWLSVLTSLDDLQVSHPHSSLVTAARVWSIEALHRLGDHDNVRHRVKILDASDATLKPAWQRLVGLRNAQALAEGGEPQQALDLIQSMADSDPHDRYWAEANVLVGRCEVDLGHYARAHKSLRNVLDSPLTLDLETYNAGWCAVGDAYLGQVRYERALDSYLRVRPHRDSRWYAAALKGAAEALEKLGRGEEALPVLRRLAKSHLDTLHRTKTRALRQTQPKEADAVAEPELPVSTTSPQ
jgi:tetratricopeptide (TPR) repeat protein